MASADAAKLPGGLRFARAHGEIHCPGQIEFAVAVAVRAGKAEIRRCWWVKDHDLGRRNEIAAVAEIEIDLQRTEGWIMGAHCGRQSTSAALPFAHRFPARCLRVTHEPHGAAFSVA